MFPWPEDIFEREFLEHSKQYITIGRTSQEFFLGLLGRFALVTVATDRAIAATEMLLVLRWDTFWIIE